MVGSAGTAAKINTGPSVRRAGGGTGKGETGPGRGGASRCGAAAGGGRRCGAWRGNGTARSDERCGRARSVPAAASPFVWGRVSARGVRGDVRPRPFRVCGGRGGSGALPGRARPPPPVSALRFADALPGSGTRCPSSPPAHERGLGRRCSAHRWGRGRRPLSPPLKLRSGFSLRPLRRSWQSGPEAAALRGACRDGRGRCRC